MRRPLWRGGSARLNGSYGAIRPLLDAIRLTRGTQRRRRGADQGVSVALCHNGFMRQEIGHPSLVAEAKLWSGSGGGLRAATP
jgi:hypothetical protein